MNLQVKPVKYPTTADTSIILGDRVRSFDFLGNAECYWVGTVVEITDLDQYKIKVDYQVWENRRQSINYCDMVCPPINGLRSLFGFTRGVQKILEGELA